MHTFQLVNASPEIYEDGLPLVESPCANRCAKCEGEDHFASKVPAFIQRALASSHCNGEPAGQEIVPL
jgi:hypothetical protein